MDKCENIERSIHDEKSTQTKAHCDESKSVEHEAIITAEVLTENGYNADFSIDSLAEIDRYINDKMLLELRRRDGVIFSQILIFSIGLGAYLGKTIVDNCLGVWEIMTIAPGEIKYNVKIGEMVFSPVEIVLKRLEHGSKASVHQYGLSLIKLQKNKKDI